MRVIHWTTVLLFFGVMLAACGGDDDKDDGPQHYTVGIIAIYTPLDDLTDGFKDALAGYGYVEGDNLTYAFTRALDGSIDSIIAADPDAVLCVTMPACDLVQAHADEAGLPVVFVTEIDPVLVNLADEWSHPGGNFTGISVFTQDARTEGRRLQLLTEIDPAIQRIFVPYNTSEVSAPIKLAAIQDAADALGVELVLAPFETEAEEQQTASTIPDDVDALFTFSEKIYAVESAIMFPNIAIMHHIPYSGATVEFGALMSYGPDYYTTGQQAARLVDQILKGTPPGELPVEVPDFVLSINLKTARFIGLEVPDAIVSQAQHIVR